MSRTVIKDAGGSPYNVFIHDGNVYPNWKNINSLLNLKQFTVRDDDVVLCAYPKSGTHWIWEATRLLKAGKLFDDALDKGIDMIEYTQQYQLEEQPSPRLLNTHMRPSLLPDDIFNKKCKIINVVRNPKDVIVSYYNFSLKLPHTEYSGKWRDYVEHSVRGKFPFGSWYDYISEWEDKKRRNPSIPWLTLYFEDVRENPLREMKKLNVFLSTNRSEEFLAQICEHTSFTKMRDRKSKIDIDHGAFPGAYRKGEVGDWKNWFTVAQNERFDDLYRRRMRDSELNIRFTIP